MANPAAWHTLHTQSSDLPRLLLKAHLDNSGYTIQLTDLSRIWTQTLQKHEIIAQAKRYKCSIDPSEDDDQYQILLDKIRTALGQEVQTSLSLTPTKDGKLKLDITSPLPKPLPELDWTIILSQAPDSLVATELVTPLLQQADHLNIQMQRLIAELQAKDKVIARVLDRLEQANHDLTAVFPQVSGTKLSKKTSQKEQLGKHVRGLGKFDEEAWEKQVGVVEGGEDLEDGAVDGVFARLPAAVARQDDGGRDWWRELAVGRSVELSGTSNAVSSGQAVDVGDQGSTDDEHEHGRKVDEDDDFQRQGTPPHLRSGSPPLETSQSPKIPSQSPLQRHFPHRPQPDITMADADDETDDEDDLDARSQPSQRSRPLPQPQSSRRAVTLPKPPLPKKTTPRKPLFEEEEDSDETDDLDAPAQPSQKPIKTLEPSSPVRGSVSPPPVVAKAPGKKLGTLGGRARKPSPPPPKDPSPAPEESPPPTSSTPKTKPGVKKLGTLGGKRKPVSPPPPAPVDALTQPPSPAKHKLGTLGNFKPTTNSTIERASPAPSTTSHTSTIRPSRTTKKSSEPPAPEETEEERADAKRKALKRELEEKAKAGVKKKRKF